MEKDKVNFKTWYTFIVKIDNNYLSIKPPKPIIFLDKQNNLDKMQMHGINNRIFLKVRQTWAAIHE